MSSPEQIGVSRVDCFKGAGEDMVIYFPIYKIIFLEG